MYRESQSPDFEFDFTDSEAVEPFDDLEDLEELLDELDDSSDESSDEDEEFWPASARWDDWTPAKKRRRDRPSDHLEDRLVERERRRWDDEHRERRQRSSGW